MTDLTKLTTAVNTLTAQAAANTKAIADLVALAQNSGADQGAIDAITSQVAAASAQISQDDALDTTGAPAPAPAPAEPPAPSPAPAPSDPTSSDDAPSA